MDEPRQRRTVVRQYLLNLDADEDHMLRTLAAELQTSQRKTLMEALTHLQALYAARPRCDAKEKPQ